MEAEVLTKESDTRNVVDRYKGWPTDLIRKDVQAQTLPFAILMGQLESDFNIGCVVRSANGFGATEAFYYGRKKIDRRSLVGVHNYTKLTFLDSFDKIIELKNKYKFIGLETGETAVKMESFQWPENSLIIVGEEKMGIEPKLLELCDHIVQIPLIGSVRSYNAAVAASVGMYDYFAKNSSRQNLSKV